MDKRKGQELPSDALRLRGTRLAACSINATGTFEDQWMLCRIPLLGLFRLEPVRDLKRAWLWITAPPACKQRGWSVIDERAAQIRSLSDADLLLGVNRTRRFYLCEWGQGEVSQAYVLEAKRRGLPDDSEPIPQWVQTVSGMPQPLRHLAEKMLRPWGC